MRTLRRIAAGSVLVLAATAGLVAVGPVPAASAGGHGQGHGQGGPPEGEDLGVTGDFTATGTLEGGCAIFHQVVTGSGEWTSLGAATFVLDFCTPEPPAGGDTSEIYDGTFTVTAADGGTLSGTMTGPVQLGGPGPEFPFVFTLAADPGAGTGRYQGATGSIVMTGAFGLGAFTARGSVEGTVTLPPTTPGTVSDCRRGGWRDVVDHRGRPFRSQGHCIRWARRHA